MAVFPRGTKAKPRLITPARFPGALQSWGNTGRGQFRATQNIGREWQETYPVLDGARAEVRALMAALNKSLRQPVVWQVQHLYWQTRLGVGGGAPLIAGAGQTGDTLLIDGAAATITNWLRAGDIIAVAGCPVVLDVTADVNTNGAGEASIPISPPIFVGQAPADNASVTIDPAAIYFNAVIVDISEFPAMDTTRYIDAGMTITWREQPT